MEQPPSRTASGLCKAGGITESIDWRKTHSHALHPGLNGAVPQLRREVVCEPVAAVDGEELSLEFAAEDARRWVPTRTCQRAPSKRAINVNRTSRHDLRA